MKKLLLFFISTAALFAQSHAWNCFPDATLTEDIYWASQPQEVQELRFMDNDSQRAIKATELAASGFTIDVPIMVWKWSAVCTMGVRQQQGFTWVPSALQAPIPVAPGLVFPGLPSYDPNHPPVGSIRVSLNSDDYPPVVTPVINPVVPQAKVVGVCYQGDSRIICALGPGADINTIKDGASVSEGGFKYIAHVAQGLMGKSAYFTRQ